MRSPFINDFRKQLSELNNSFSHYIFVWEQFYIDNDNLLKTEPEKLTTDVYTSNSNARQFRVKLKFLDDSHQTTYVFILKSMFLVSYSEFEVYMRSIYEFARKIDSTLPNLMTRERIPDDIFQHLNLDMKAIFNEEEIQTFEYLRLRRNRITHTGGKSKGDLAEIIRHKGNSIQKYWNATLHNGLFGIDFRSQVTEEFTKEEIFDLINIWRFLIEKVDITFCDRIGKEELVKYLKSEFKETFKVKLKYIKPSQARSKFKNFCVMEFNITLSSKELDTIDLQ